ncbi:MAG: glycosyltransferase family 4 protein, partial [Myxococcales bacterium]|nr:glycosyltransferase family 4 protein [Myxococcales bacterium]
MDRPTLFAHDELRVRGGAEAALLEVAEVANERGPVSLALMFEGPRRSYDGDQLSTFDRVLQLRFPRSMRPRQASRYAQQLRALRRAIADAGQAVAFGWGSAFRLALAGLGTGTALAWSCLLDPPYNRGRWGGAKDRAALQLMARAGMRIACTCDTAREAFLAGGYPARLLTTIPNAVDLARLRTQSEGTPHWPLEGRAGMRLLCLARLDGNKNQELLIRAVAACRRRGVNVALACVGGENPLWPEYRQTLAGLRASLDVADRVALIEEQSSVAPWLHSADAAVLASHSESGMPRALLEAGAAGLPLLASHAGGMPELVQPGLTGALFDARDVEDCADAICTLARDAQLRTRCGSLAAETIR